MKQSTPRLLGQLMVLACVPLFLACGDQPVPIMRERANPVRGQERPERPRVAYFEGTHASEAIKQVRDKVGEPFRVLQIMVFSDRVDVQAQDPKKPENVDEYRVSGGTVEGPIPVRLIGQTDEKTLRQNVFDPSDVALDRIPDLVKEASAKVVLEGRKDDPSVTIKRKLPFEEAVSIDVDYSGVRKNGYLHTDRHGKNGKVTIF